MEYVSSDADRHICPGVFVAVAGPSGGGKDSILQRAKQALAGDPAFLFSRRYVTRPAGQDEDNDALTLPQYAKMIASGNFALAWDAHGLRYAIPAQADQEIMAGRVVIANLSRTAMETARNRYRTCKLVLIDAPPDVRAARLAGRSRETTQEIVGRLARTPPDFDPGLAELVIDNSGALETAANQFIAFLRSLRVG